MADESNAMPTSQVVRWAVVGLLILAAVALYFRHGPRVPPLEPAPVAPAAPTAADTLTPS